MAEKRRAKAKGSKTRQTSTRRTGRNAQKASPKPPNDFNARSKRVWNEVIAYLEREDLFRDVQLEMVELYVSSVVRSIEYRKIADKEPTVEGSQGQPVANPAAKMANEAEASAHRWAESLLITPAAIQRHLKGEDGDGDDEDDLGF